MLETLKTDILPNRILNNVKTFWEPGTTKKELVGTHLHRMMSFPEREKQTWLLCDANLHPIREHNLSSGDPSLHGILQRKTFPC